MIKGLVRATQKKQNFMITVRMARFGVSSLSIDTTFQVVWQRGKEKQTTGKVELNEFETDSEINEVMSKVSSFYSKDNVTFEKKLCNFNVLKCGEGGSTTQVATVEVNMAEYVNHTDATNKIELTCDEYSGMFLEVLWTINESDERGGTVYQKSSDLGLAVPSEVGKMSEDQIKEIFEKAQKLEEQNSDLEQQVDLVLSAKANLEKILNDERKNAEKLKQQLKAAEEKKTEAQNQPIPEPVAVESNKEEFESLKKEVETLKTKESKFADEILYITSLIQKEKDRSVQYQQEITEEKAKVANFDTQIWSEKVKSLALEKQLKDQKKDFDELIWKLEGKTESQETKQIPDGKLANLGDKIKKGVAGGYVASTQGKSVTAGAKKSFNDNIDDFAF